MSRARAGESSPRWRSAGPFGEFAKFMVVGTSGIVVNLGAYYVLTRHARLPLTIASPLAIEASVLWNFLLNDRWTFRDRTTEGRSLVRLGRFHAVGALAGIINYVLLLLLAAVGLWDMLANLIGIVLGASTKFAVNSRWTWREHSGRHVESVPVEPAP